MSLKLKVFVAIAVGCSALAAAVIQIGSLEIRAAKAYVADIEMPRRVSAVIHEMQIERGQSVGFISSGYDQGALERVTAQRVKVDTRITELENYLSLSDRESMARDVALAVEHLREDLAGLGTFRSRVDAQDASVPNVVGFYTNLINDQIEILGHIAQHSKTEAVTSRMLPFLALVKAKEHGGLERAIGAALLNQAAAGQVKLDTYQKYLFRLAGEHFALEEFKIVSSGEYKAWFDTSVKNAPVIAEVERVRDVLASILQTNDAQGIAGSAWFGTATERLNLFKAVEDRIVEDLERVAAEGFESKWAETLVIAGIGASALLLSLWLGLNAIRGFSAGFKHIGDDIERLSLGDLSDGFSCRRGFGYPQASAADQPSANKHEANRSHRQQDGER